MQRARMQIRSRSDRARVRRPIRRMPLLEDPEDASLLSLMEASSSVTLRCSSPGILRKTTSALQKM